MQLHNSSQINLNKFFKSINLKKQYITELKKKAEFLTNVKEKNYKSLKANLFEKTILPLEDFLVTYIIDITFLRSNIYLSVMDFNGNLKFFCSAGSLGYKGKSKRFRAAILKEFYQILVLKLKFLKHQPIALHLKNAGYSKKWIIRLLSSKLFIRTVKNFTNYPHNGCRKKKARRKKIKKKRRNGRVV